MDLYYKNEVSVGALVLAAAALFLLGLMWLSGIPLGRSSASTVAVQFSDVSGLDEGDPVYVSGVRVGRVDRLVLEDIGRVRAELEVPRNMAPHADASASVTSLDFLGSMKVDYQPGSADAMLAEGRVIAGSRGGGLGEVTDRLPEMANRASDMMRGIESMLNEDMATQLRQTLESTQRALATIERAGKDGTVEQATEALRAMHQVAVRLDSVLANPSIDQSLEGVNEAMTSLKEMLDGLSDAMGALASVLDKVDDGEGSLSLALNEPTLHDDLHATLVSMRELLDDMRERPGRYFRLKVF